MNRFPNRLASVCLAALFALAFMPAPALAAAEGGTYGLTTVGLSAQAISSQLVQQTDATKTSVTVEWGWPEIFDNPDAVFSYWRVSWREHGTKKWGKPVVVSGIANREYKITGLAQGKTYDVRVGYRYKVDNDDGGYVNIAEWRSCTASTFTMGTTGTSGWNYAYVAHNEYPSFFEALVSAAKPGMYLRYQCFVNSGAKFNTKEANEYTTSNVSNSYSKGKLDISHSNSTYMFGANWEEDNAVATLGIRAIQSFPGSTKSSIGSWQKKTLIADPQFSTTYQKGTFNLVVEIPPLKNAQSYTVYVGKYVSGSSGVQVPGRTSMKVKGWKKAGTVAANSSETVSVVVGKYGKKKIGQGISTYGVKVVTHTKYGNSPGRYWVEWTY